VTLSLNKSIQGQLLHPRTGAPTTDNEVTIPFGAILEYVGPDRDFEKYKYMGDMYRTPHSIFASATKMPKVEAAPAAEPEAEHEAAPAAELAALAPAGPRLAFETVPATIANLKRAKVPGGWLVALGSSAITFYPDPEHAWQDQE
jgi:hypothetical protein